VTQSERQGAGVADEEIGRTLADIWRKVLDIDHVDPDADFFDLGGDSLLAMRVVARIRQVFGIQFSVKQMFRSARLSRLAAAVAAARRNEA